VGEKEKPEEWKKKGGMGEARAAAPAPRPWQPAGVRRIPQAPCLSLCSGRKREEELGGEGAEGCPWEGRRRRAAGPHVAGRQARPPDGGDAPCWSR
jgi:hypothetical protein